jgi:hypothetical protein
MRFTICSWSGCGETEAWGPVEVDDRDEIGRVSSGVVSGDCSA